jgi:hypothetical protein
LPRCPVQLVLPVLHKALALLLLVLLYTAQNSEGALQVHLLIMSALALCLWGCVTL